MQIKMETLVPGSTHTIPGYIMTDGRGWLTHMSTKLPGYTVLCEHAITFTVPAGYNVVAKMVEAIDEQITKLSDDYQRHVAPLREKRAQLLQISYGGAEILDAVDAPRAVRPLDEECAQGLHSWSDAVGKLPPDTECTRCGELYGHPD